MGTSPINTNVGDVGHAHPLPLRPVPHAQRVRAAMMRVPIAVNLRGLLFGRAVTVSDVFMPKIRRAPFNEDVNPGHLDVTECWKGLSHTQAGELTMWYHFLHDCLHNEVREALSKDVVKELLEGEEFDEVYAVPRMLECLRSKPQRIVDISFVDVIDSMMAMFHDQFPNESASITSSWSQFSGGLSLFLHNFLRVQDCFRHSATGPCLKIKLDFQYKDWVLIATGDVVWQPPNIRFLHVPTIRASGELYRITPFVWDEASSPVRSPGCDHYVDQVEYTIPRSTLQNITWDPEKKCFKAIIGAFRDGKPHIVETVVMATLTTPFTGSVKFEKQSRWSLKLVVTPNHVPLTPNTDRSELPTREAALRHLMAIPLPVYDQKTVSRDSVGIAPNLLSPQKRKVSKPEVVGEVVTKRIRHDLISDHALNGINSSDDCYEPKCIHLVGQDAGDHMVPFHQSHPAWTEHHQQYDSGYLSASRSPATSAQSELSNDAAAGRPALQQAKILDNYYEFKDRRFFKDAGLISPVSDGERKAYENIFLGGSDEWSPITEGSGVDLDTVMEER